MSSPKFAKTIPVNPPIVDGKMDPAAGNMGVLYHIEPPYMVAIWLEILISVETSMIMIAALVTVALQSPGWVIHYLSIQTKGRLSSLFSVGT